MALPQVQVQRLRQPREGVEAPPRVHTQQAIQEVKEVTTQWLPLVELAEGVVAQGGIQVMVALGAVVVTRRGLQGLLEAAAVGVVLAAVGSVRL